MLVKILIVLAIALLMGVVLWLMIRRSGAEAAPQPGGHRGASPQGPGRASFPSGVPSSRAGGPESLAAQLNWLVGMGGDVVGKTFHVGNRTGTIGRGLGNFIQTTDPDASRVHCQFMPVPGGLQLKDMDSSNGTYVNERRITVNLLRDGDQVRIGKAVFVYRARGDFQVDFGVQQRKMAGAAAARETQLGKVGDLGTMVRQAWEQSGGDAARAAQTMGVPVEHFLKMLAEFGNRER